MFWATREGHLPVIKTLVAAGASANLRSTCDGRAPLHVATAEGIHEIASALLNGGARKNCTDKFGHTPLLLAATNGRLAVAKRRRRRQRPQHRLRSSALLAAAIGGHGEFVSALLLKGAEKNAIDNAGETALFWAADRGHLLVVRNLLVASADLCTSNPADGFSHLLEASVAGHDKVVSGLLLMGADQDALDMNGSSAHSLAVAGGQQAVGVARLAAGADVEFHSSAGVSALERATLHGSVGVVKALIGHGAAVDCRDSAGRTALHHTALNNQTGVVDELVDAGRVWS